MIEVNRPLKSGAPWPLGGRDPGDKDGGNFSVFVLEASVPTSGTLDTSWGPVEGRTGPKRPHWERNPASGSIPEEREPGMLQPTPASRFRAGAASGLSPERYLRVGLG